MINFSHKNEILTLENDLINFEFDVSSGLMNFYDKDKQNYVISKAISSISYESTSVNTSDSAEVNWEIEEFEDEIDKGMALILNFLSKLGKAQFKLIIKLFETRPFIFLQNVIVNTLNSSIRIKIFGPISLSESYLSRIDLDTSINDWKILAGAYQSWSLAKLLSPFDKNDVPKVPDFFIPASRILVSNPEEKREKHELIGDNYIMIKNLKTQRGVLFGFLTFKDQLSNILFQFNKNKRTLKKLIARAQADNIILEPNEELFSELLMINFVTPPLENLILYADVIKIINKPIPWDNIPVGYCTWYYYYQRITEAEAIKNVKFIASHHDEIPIKYFQIDDGYEKDIGEWEANEKFPNGMKSLVDKINNAGFEAGLWVAPFMIGKKSSLYEKHPDWVLRDKKGNPIEAQKHNPAWGFFNPSLALDCSHPEVQDWLRTEFTKITKDWGFNYIKIDFIYAACVSSNFYNKKMTRAQVYRKGLEIIRETIGPNVLLLGCGAPLGPSIGLVNAMRVSTDTAPNWNPIINKMGQKLLNIPNIPCIFNAMKNNIRSFFMHKKLWINDPDCLMVRFTKTGLKEEEIKTEITCIALLNGYYFLSDDFSQLDKESIKLIKMFYPFDGNTAIPLDLFESEIPEILDLTITKEFGDWHIVGIFNWSDKTKNIVLNMDALGCEKEKEYHVFEFWEQKYYGIYKEKITFSNMLKHSCKLIAIKEVKYVPQLLSTTIHFTQGAVEVRKCDYNTESNELQLIIEFPGKNGGSLFFFNPKGNEWKVNNNEKYKLVMKSKEIYELKVDFENYLEITIFC